MARILLAMATIALIGAASATAMLHSATTAHSHKHKQLAKLREKHNLPADPSIEDLHPSDNLVLVSSNYTWAENLWFDNAGHMFVSDWNVGTLFRLSTQGGKNATEPGAFPAVRERWAGGDGRYKLVLGQQFIPESNSLLFVAKLNRSGISSIINVSTLTPDSDYVWANTTCLGNGLSYIPSPVDNLYTPCENDFIPGIAEILEMDTHINATLGVVSPINIFDSGLWSGDGAYWYEPDNTLYVSDVVGATVLVYNLSGVTSNTKPGEDQGKSVLIRKYKAPGMLALDDFCVVTNPLTGKATLIGAGFLEHRIVAYDASLEATANNKPPEKFTVVATGIHSPTSVRPGMGPNWSGPGLFYVSEGGPLSAPGSINNKRIWQLTVDWEKI